MPNGAQTERTDFRYAGGGRYLRVDSGSAGTTTTRYLGSVEWITRAGGTVERKRYIGGFLILTETGPQATPARQYRYVLPDHLGSLDTLVDQNGIVQERMSFDAHGSRRAASGSGIWQTLISNPAPANTTRGFTGHEHVDRAGIVHMNGRLYDPLLGRMLSADPIVQEPENAQNLNRYTYVLNNPLSYTDPTGLSFFKKYWRSIASIAINIFLPGFGLIASTFWNAVLTGFISGVVASGSLQGGLIGAFSAGVFQGIGSIDMSVGARILAHAVAGGTMSALQGGKFGHGFASAGVTQAFAPEIGRIGGGAKSAAPARILAAAILGGTSTVLSGGKFANGAVTAAFSYAARGAAGDGDGGGEPSPASVADAAVYTNGDWLRRGVLSLNCSSSECALQANLSVSADAVWSAEEAFQWMAQIDHAWNVSHYNIAEGMRYSVRVSLSLAAPGVRGDLHFGYEDLGFGNFARAWGGSGLITMHTPVRGTAPHEFGHNLGLRHFPNFTGGMMSYAPSRSVQPVEVNRLINAYRFPYSAGFKR